MKSIDKKLVDSSAEVSKGGRAQNYWMGVHVARSKYYDSDKSTDTVDQFAVIKKYSLKGFEYGNWVNNNDRNDRLTATNESFADMANIIGSKNIGFDGTLGIAFGARGHSKFAAHFEPSTFMINLTKENGFGALAHEYGHALDYFFGMYVDQNSKDSSLVGGDTTRAYLDTTGLGTLRKMANEVVNNATKDKGSSSKSYQNWEKAEDGEYWFRRNEIFARTFEQWVRSKLHKKGIKNTFLAAKKYESTMYLTLPDFNRVSPYMDKLIKEMGAFMNNKKKSIGFKINTAVKTAARK
jgi:hypothetical protein